MIKKFCHEESDKEKQGCESKKKKNCSRERVALQKLPIDRNDQGNQGNEVKAGKFASSLHSLNLSAAFKFKCCYQENELFFSYKNVEQVFPKF